MIDANELRSKLKKLAPTLFNALEAKAAQWTESSLQRLDSHNGSPYPKTFNDPVWGDITLYPWETVFLDSQLLQRLRGVRQLGMAHLVYPGAGYDRLEHSRGVVEAAERMINALTRNAEFRRRFGKDKDEHVPNVDYDERVSIRLAALLHDIGHGAFSHATEMLIKSRASNDFAAIEDLLRKEFSGVKSIAPAEIIAISIVMSDALRKIFEHPKLGASSRPSEIPSAICARILGSRDHLRAGYLSGIVSGPLDADKLDYMARDSHHAGLPIGLDLHRLISKLEVVTITPTNAMNEEMRSRAESAPHKKYHEIGISLSGLGAYEQMIIARVILYDRLYYHHKVRAAEAMIRQLIQVAEHERGKPFSIGELFFDLPDDTATQVLGGILKSETLQAGTQRSRDLAIAIQERNIYYRAFAFAPRFIAGLMDMPDEDKRDARALLWNDVLKELSSLEGCDRLSRVIFEKAGILQRELKDLLKINGNLRSEHVLVDFPLNKVVARGGDILTRTEDGCVAPPNLFFDPERWSQAYEQQKQCGFVYAPREYVRLVGLASRIVFFETFRVAMGSSSDRSSKTSGDIKSEWFREAAKKGLCSNDLAGIYEGGVPHLVPMRRSDLEAALPEAIRRDAPDIIERLLDEFAIAAPQGFAPKVHKSIVDILRHGSTFQQTLERNGDFVERDNIEESELQSLFRKHIEAQGGDVIEGSKEAGGETDLVLSKTLVIENKVLRDATDSPLESGPKFSWQARRYAMALSQHVVVEYVAYKPKNEAAHLPLAKSIVVSKLQSTEFSVIRFITPWGQRVPSSAKSPRT